MRIQELFEASPPTSAEFKRWFAGSKVVDEHGNPLIVYHGTHRDFASFNPGAGGIGLTFFSTDPKMATAYAGDHGLILPCVLRITKPYDYRKTDNQRIARAFFQSRHRDDDIINTRSIKIGLYGHPDIEDDDNPDITSDPLELHEFAEALDRGIYSAIEDPEFLTFLRSHGCDGVSTYEMDAVNWAIFEPQQAKSIFARSFSNSPNISENS